MSNLNTMYINDVDQFSDLSDVIKGLVGKYGKNYQHEYQMTLIKNVCFITTIADCTIQIPDHYTFSYADDNGSHIIQTGTNNLTVKGITSFFFHMKNS